MEEVRGQGSSSALEAIQGQATAFSLSRANGRVFTQRTKFENSNQTPGQVINTRDRVAKAAERRLATCKSEHVKKFTVTKPSTLALEAISFVKWNRQPTLLIFVVLC